MNISYYRKHPLKAFFQTFSSHGVLNFLPSKYFLRIKFYLEMGRRLNLKCPKTFNEKLQWLKLHDRKLIYTTMVDKYKVKKYVGERIGNEYIIPTLGVWKTFDQINFDDLPNQFVLKCTHDSGGVIVCKDKSKLDLPTIRKKIEKALNRNYYYSGREWPYKNVPPQIIVEKFLSEDGYVPIDYKVYCFDGRPYKIMLCLDRDKDEPTKFYSFDFNWKLLRHNRWGKVAPEDFSLPKPINLEKMYEYAKILSKDIPFVRVDFYEVAGRLFFGELTFYPDSGFDYNIMPEVDELYGKMIKLPIEE